jgi:gamma-glutamyltranspeptidase / glutathione hydrolase
MLKDFHHGCFDCFSGRAPAALTLARANDDGFNENNPIPQQHGHAVTVPGAAAAWIDTVEKFGSGNVRLRSCIN